jgi:class 3 adenylate cyclase
VVTVPVRPLVWLLHVALPVAGLVLLIQEPVVDHELMFDHQRSHFLLVLVTALIGCALAVKAGIEARRHGDGRLFLVAISFLVASGFLGLHALGTPGILLDAANTGFVLATPVGLALASLPALVSAVVTRAQGRALLAYARTIFAAVALVFAVWGVWSLGRFAPLDGQPTVEEHRAAFAVVAGPAALAYLAVSARYFLQYRRRPSVVLLAVLTAFVLLAEAALATLVGRNWQASWWSWHVLMTAAFALVAYAALVEFAREGSTRTLFRGVALDETIARVQRGYAAALDAVVMAVESGRPASVQRLAAELGERYRLSDAQVQLLAEAADALGRERERARKLGALVAIGQDVSVIRTDREVITRAVEHLRAGFAPDDVTVELDPRAVAGNGGDNTLAAPLLVKGRPAGVVTVRRRAGTTGEHDVALLSAVASQLSIAVENARLYHELDRLFRQYLSPDVAAALLADPAQAALGGEIREVTVVFADLQGFTTFSERREPQQVVDMLNTYFGRAVPLFLAEGGTVAHFIGDALMVLFNAPVLQPDHAQRAVRAATAVGATIDEVAAAHPGWPRIRVGINSGSALIGNIGGEDVRCFTAIGDTVNLASRLETLAPPGGVVIGPRTRELIGADAVVQPLGAVSVKGKDEPVQAYVLDPGAVRSARPRPGRAPAS